VPVRFGGGPTEKYLRRRRQLAGGLPYVVGNATRDAERHQSSSGKPVTNIRLATNRTVAGKEEPQYFTVICFDRLAEAAGAYVKTGRLLYVEGRLQTRKFQDRQGLTREVTEIVASDVQFLDHAGEASRGEEAAAADEAVAGEPAEAA